MSSSKSLDGRIVAITGGARGIGLATARALQAAGARVAVGDIDAAAAAGAAEILGDTALATTLDVRDPGSFARFLDLVERELGPLDVLVNNAGIMPIGAFLEEADDRARRAVEINVLGPLQGTKLALRRMVPRRRGHIVNVASIAGKSPVPGGITYAASKAAIVSLTESARVEFAGSGVQFTCVMPSFTATELIAGTKGTRFVPTVAPEDVAAAIVAAIATPRPDVFVPTMVGHIARLQPFLGRRLRDALNHLIGADRTFLDVDQGARAAYDRRIADGGESARADADADTDTDTDPTGAAAHDAAAR